MPNMTHTRSPIKVRAAILAGALCVFATGSAIAASRTAEWATIHHPKFGFTIAYPSDILFPVETPSGRDGRVMQSADGRAKLLVATFENTENTTLDGYRDFLLSDIYANATIDYAPQKTRWFVLSGVRGGETFYERVTFSCGGKLINSWAMLYPTAEKKLYDRVLERIAKTYSVGAGREGSCDFGDAGGDSKESEPQSQTPANQR